MRSCRPFQWLCAFITFAVLCLASGCSLLSSDLDRAAKGAGDLVTFYCENVTVPDIRENFRAAVNAHASPHSVVVTCANGGEPLIASPDNPTGANLMPSKNPYELSRIEARNASIVETVRLTKENRTITTTLLDQQRQIITDQDTIISTLHVDLDRLREQLEASKHALANTQQELTAALAAQARETHDPVNHPIPNSELGGAIVDADENRA